MSHLNLSADIAASPSRVWQALCDPDEVGEWDSGVERALDAPPDYPKPGQHVRWRCRGGFFRVLQDLPQEVVTERTLRSLLSLGMVRYDETYTLTPVDAGTRLEIALEVRVALPVIGPLIERLRAREDARRGFQASLLNLKHHCEAEGQAVP